jgi:hypothetical protein
LSERFEFEKANLAKLRGDLGDIFSGKHGGFVDSCKALYGVFKEQRAHILALRDDVVALIESEKKWLAETVGEWKAIGQEIQTTLDDFKALVENPKDAVLDIALGPEPELGKDIAALADEFGYGDQAAKFFGVESPSLKSGAGGFAEAPAASLAPLASGHYLPSQGVVGALGGAVPGGAGSAGGALLAAPSSLPTTSTVSALGGAAVTSRAGGIGAHDVVGAVRPGQLGFLQSPVEGQRMIVSTERALALDPTVVNQHLVEAQLQGKAPGAAMNDLLDASGYAVYERPWGDFAGPFEATSGKLVGA